MTIESFENFLLEQLKVIYELELEYNQLIPKLKEKTDNLKLIEILEGHKITAISNAKKIENLEFVAEYNFDEAENAETKCLLDCFYSYLNNESIIDYGILCFLDKINAYKSATYNTVIKLSRKIKYFSDYQILQNLNNHNYNMIDKYHRFENDNYDLELLDEEE